MVRTKKFDFVTPALLALVLVGVAASGAWAQDSPVPPVQDMLFYWTPATSGAPAVRYDVQVEHTGSSGDTVVDTDSTEALEYLVHVTGYLVPYRIRVRGVNAGGEPGPWSDWSDLAVRDFEDIDSPH